MTSSYDTSAMKSLESLKEVATREAYSRNCAPSACASASIAGHEVMASIVPNTRAFSRTAKTRCDWYVDGKRVSYNSLITLLGAA